MAASVLNFGFAKAAAIPTQKIALSWPIIPEDKILNTKFPTSLVKVGIISSFKIAQTDKIIPVTAMNITGWIIALEKTLADFITFSFILFLLF